MTGVAFSDILGFGLDLGLEWHGLALALVIVALLTSLT